MTTQTMSVEYVQGATSNGSKFELSTYFGFPSFSSNPKQSLIVAATLTGFEVICVTG